MIPTSVDHLPLVPWIASVCVLIPPAGAVFYPLCLRLPWNVDSIRIHIIDATVNPFICCHSTTGFQIIPNITALQPSGFHVSTGIQIIPVSTNFLPTSLHIAVSVKMVPTSINVLPLVSWIRTICILIPPASSVLFPLCRFLSICYNLRIQCLKICGLNYRIFALHFVLYFCRIFC